LGQATVEAMSVGPILSDDRAARLAAAEAKLTRVLALAPDNPLAHLYIGVVKIHSNRVTQGIAECERALGLDPNLALAHGYIGLAKYFLGRGEETESHVEKARGLSLRDREAYYWYANVGVAKTQLGDNEEAVAWLRRSIDANRTFALAHFALGGILAQLDQLDEASAAIKAGLLLDPGFTVARYRAYASTDNPLYITGRKRLAEGMRKAGVPEG
jgi:tetratricopeptide (TPR) repeat protein